MSRGYGYGEHARQVAQWYRSGRDPQWDPEPIDDDSDAPPAPPYVPVVYRDAPVVPDTIVDIDTPELAEVVS